MMFIFPVLLLAVAAAYLYFFTQKTRNHNTSALRKRYQNAKQFTEDLRAAERVYANDADEQPINKLDYMSLLAAFEKLLTWVDKVPDAYDTDFRRNLPGGGMDGLTVAPDMPSRIEQARRFLQNHQATATMGQSIVQNIDACLNLIRHDAPADEAISSVAPIVARVASGTIR